MDGMTNLHAAGISASERFPVESDTRNVSMADQMKAVSKTRLNRQALVDPTMIAKLVALTASPVYNAKGDLIQAVAPVNAFTA